MPFQRVNHNYIYFKCYLLNQQHEFGLGRKKSWQISEANKPHSRVILESHGNDKKKSIIRIVKDTSNKMVEERGRSRRGGLLEVAKH